MFKKSARLVVGVFVGLIVISLLLYYIVKLTEPASEVKNLFLSNITDHQATLSWTTKKPTRGQILLSEINKFPLLPFWNKKWEKDDGEKSLPTTNFYLTHHITIGDLKPNTTYYFRIYQGWKKALQGQFTTGSTINNLLPPNPVYGQVILADKKPLVGGLVYLEVKEASASSALISTLTNKDGRWSLDLANLRSADLKQGFKISSRSAERVYIDAGPKGRVKSEIKPGQDKPWPNIILK